MGAIILTVSIILSLLFSTVTQNIERTFLQNNQRMLYVLLPSASNINLSFPDPISFSDQVSKQQAYFLFQRIFSSFSTFEFYSESQSISLRGQSIIFKARWSFRDKKNNNQYVFHLFFYLLNMPDQNNIKLKNNWKIIEIKAKKI